MSESQKTVGKLEIIVETYQDIVAAIQGGATQLDLKAHYPCSGVSPSAGIIARAIRDFKVPLMVMVRPHARTFVMSKEDIRTACEEIKQARQLGAQHFLTGFLTEDNDLDTEALKELRDAAGDSSLHSHLAWELSRDPLRSLEQLIELGFCSVRASGKTASSGAFGGDVSKATATIIKYQKVLAGRMELFMAGGVDVDNIENLILQTGITNLHCGRSARNPKTAEAPVDEERVRALRSAQMDAISRLEKKMKI